MINFADIAREANLTAVAKGWYERDENGCLKQRDFDEVCALFHSEISEAVEELRDPASVRRPSGIYYPNVADALIENPDSLPQLQGAWQKPEGVAVELADLIIRLGDSALAWDCAAMVDHDLQKMNPSKPHHTKKPVGLMAALHQSVSRLYERLVMRDIAQKPLGDCMVSLEIAHIVGWTQMLCDHFGWELERAIKLKMAYNKNRPVRHGGKLA